LIYSVFLSLLMLTFSQVAQADVYKCKDANNKTLYSQSPCSADKTGSKIDVQSSRNATYAQEPVKAPIIKQLDSSVAAAIAKGDFAHAERIAVTKEQWEAIGSAKKELASSQNKVTTGRTEADLSAEKGSSIECEQAKRKYDVAVLGADSFNQAKIDAKESLMRQACGIKEPTEVNVNNTNINNYGSGTRSRYR